MKTPVSVAIIAKNEEKRIKDCLESVHGWVDEIVIIDDNSTDRTVEIAKNYTDKIFSRKMDLEGKQRNFAAAQATNDWVLILDCDERVTPELKEEILHTLENIDEKTAAYWVPSHNFIADTELKFGGWDAPHMRLYNKNHVRWKEIKQDVVHPGIETDPGFGGGNLKQKLIHFNFAHTEDFINKVNRQSTLEAIKWHLDGRKMGLGKAMWRTIDRFFRRFIGKKGYKDGYYGFVGAVLSGFYQWAAYSKYREIREKGLYLKQYKIEDDSSSPSRTESVR